MRFSFSFYVLLLACVLLGCHTNEPAIPTSLTKEQQLQQNLATLKKTALTGDLLVKLTDDIISQQVTGMNERDKRYSHSGLIVEREGKKLVYHIAPEVPVADTIQMEPLDSFINPEKNIRCALFRYQLSPTEKNLLMQEIANYKAKEVRFDPVYDLSTDDKLYCSELISKSLTHATGNRMQFRTTTAPPGMQKMLLLFFKNQHISKQIIATRPFISLDNLYLRPDCAELMQFDLKIFPGQ